MNSQGIEFREGGIGHSFLYWSARWLLALIGKDHGELQTTLMGLLDIAANNNYPLVKNLLECVEIVNRHEAAVTAQRQLATPPVSKEQ